VRDRGTAPYPWKELSFSKLDPGILWSAGPSFKRQKKRKKEDPGVRPPCLRALDSQRQFDPCSLIFLLPQPHHFATTSPTISFHPFLLTNNPIVVFFLTISFFFAVFCLWPRCSLACASSFGQEVRVTEALCSTKTGGLNP